jgi:hypothetical protein
MTMGYKGKRSELDPQLCYETWAKVASARKAGLVLAREHGVVRPDGKPYTGQGVWQASTRYILAEPAAARKIFEEVWKANGVIVTDAQWYTFVLDKTKYLTPKNRDEYLKKHSYLIPYVKS